MQKTTVYLDRKELRQLKRLAAQRSRGSAADLIRHAVRRYLRTGARAERQSFLFKILRAKPRRSTVKNPVGFQRLLRKEWA